MMSRRLAAGSVLVVTALFATAYGQTAANPTGTWKWERAGRDGQTRTSTLKLKLEGDRLTGSITGRNGEDVAIDDASFKDNTIAFKVTRRFNDREFVRSYAGKLEGGEIKGKIGFERQGESIEREWVATRVADPTGTWTWERQGRNGQTRTSTLKLALDGDQLSGAMLGRDDQEFAIHDASIKDNLIAFQVTRRFGDREIKQEYSGKLEGSTINGTVKFNRQGEDVEREWVAKRD